MRAWIVASTMLAAVSTVRAGNDDSFFQGNEAAMMGGAVTAVGGGPGQLWYNPAGLGLNERNKLELSGSLFTLRIRQTDPFLEITAYDEDLDEFTVLAEESERNIEMLSVPSALSYTRRIGNHVTAGFGIFMQLQDAAEADRTVNASLPELETSYRYTLSYSQQRLFAGPGIGAQFGRVRLGASLFLVYDRLRIRETSSILGTIAGLDAIATEDYRLDLRRIGVELVVGAQFQFTNHFVGGVTIRGPRIKINDRFDESIQATEALGDTSDQAFGVLSARGRGNISSATSALAAPIETVISLGYRSDSLRVGFDFDLAHEFSSLFEYALTWNVRAGVMAVVSDSLEIGGGVFTDRASIFGSGGFDLFVDYYGASLAATLSTPVGLRPNEEAGAPDKLIFRTTIALRYAAGIGLAAGSFTDIASIPKTHQRLGLARTKPWCSTSSRFTSVRAWISDRSLNAVPCTAMKQLTLLAAFLSVLFSVHATAQNHPVFGNAPQTTRLPNGLTVVSVQWNTPGIVAYYTLVRVGSRDEVEAGHSGFAHLFEHMMFRGTRTMPNREYDQRILSFGADNNAFTTRDYTLYTTTAPSTVLGELMQVESDRFRNLYYDESVFRTETGAVQGEYAKAVANPGMAMWEALSEISFPRHTYGHTTLGYLRDICRMPTRFDYSRRFFRRFYTPDNSTLIVVGDVDHDELVRLARQHYGRWRGRRARVRIPTQQAPEGGRRHIPWDGAAPPQMYMGYRAPAFDGGHARGARRTAALRETAALEVVKGLVFAESAPLYQKLVVQDRALLRMGASDGMFTRDPGLFIVSATLTPPSRDFDAVVGSIQEAVGAVANGAIDAERFDAVRSHQRYSLLAGLQTPTDVAGLLGKIVAVGGNVGALDEYLEALAAVTPEDVARAARTYLIEDRRYVVTLAPRVEADGPAPEPGNPCERALGLVED